ncbi:hypothetical protein NHJ6243_009942, partial [Beauveria neobassiana]
MVDRVGDAIEVGATSPPLRRSGRTATPSSKAASVRNTVEKVNAVTRKSDERVSSIVSEATEVGAVPEVDGEGCTAEAAIAGMQRMLELMEKSYSKMRQMEEKTNDQSEIIESLHQKIGEMQQELGQAKVELKQACEELAQTRTALEAITKSPVWSRLQPSYADIARTPPESHPSNVMTISTSRTASTSSGETIYCTIDIQDIEDSVNERVSAKTIRTILETEMRAKPHNGAWRCRAVTEDRSNPQRMRVVCRNESEQDMVKKTIEEKLPAARILDDGYHRIRVDGVPRTVMLDEEGNDLPEVAAILSTANDTEVAKASWLSDRQLKNYGSILVELKKASEARRFLDEGFFYVGDVSATTAAFKHRPRPKQCYNCQELTGHRAADSAKQYHDAIRQQKRSHWENFLADHDNIWRAASYLKSGKEAAFGKVPRLTRADGTRTSSNAEQAEELLTTFFPPLPQHIDEENDRPMRNAVPMPNLTLEEVHRQLMAAKSWKAPGQDGLPMVVWQQVWPVVQDQILALFQASIDKGVLPHQWRHAKIIPLKKSDKEDYGIAGAWRPISLLCTLGKVLESVIAERISYAVETFSLLPTNHFGGRKQRSAEQALVLLQEQIYAAWRGGRVLSLVSFDVKGAYNGVFKDRLLQRMRARGMPGKMVRWIGAFCSDRTASIQVNGQESDVQALDQAGLPQGSPLSPVAYLFFNADLVQRRIDANGGAIAFIDDFTAWVTGPTAQSNLEGIRSIVEHAEDWERRSGATFNAKKTAVMHFTRNARKADTTPIVIKGQSVEPKEHTKILGVIMDARLKFQQHIPEAASKAMEAAMELKRLRGLSARTARQLFAATVTPVVDYASNVWMHAYKDKLMGQINRVQRAGAQAIVGTFMTVATSVAEAEAHIVSARERFWKRAIKMWIE